MNDHVSQWLEAYLDGELGKKRQELVEKHLIVCAQCQHEIAQLKALSGLLQTWPVPEEQIKTVDFAAAVNLRLPRTKPQPEGWTEVLRSGWRYLPVGLAGIWAAGQAILLVLGLIWMTGISPVGSITGGLAFLLGEEINAWQTWEAVLLGLLIDTGFSILIVGMFLGWMASFYLANRSQRRTV